MWSYTAPEFVPNTTKGKYLHNQNHRNHNRHRHHRLFLFSKGSSINYIITFGGLGRIIYFLFYQNFYQFEIICYQLQLLSNLDNLVSKKGKVWSMTKLLSVPTSLSDLENLIIWSQVQAIHFGPFYAFFKAAYSHLIQLVGFFHSKLARPVWTLTLTSFCRLKTVTDRGHRMTL